MDEVYHNIDPSMLSIIELIHYASFSADPWVKELAKHVDRLSCFASQRHYDNKFHQFDPDEYIDDLESRCTDAEYLAEELQTQISESEDRINELIDQVKALKFDLDKTNENNEIIYLKSRLHDLTVSHRQIMSDLNLSRSALIKITKDHEILTEKYHTWTIIAT